MASSFTGPHKGDYEEDSTIVAHQRMKALTIINLSIKYEVIPHMSHLDNPHEVWTILKYLYESTWIARRLMFKNKFYKLTMQDETNMLDFLFTIKDLLV